MRTGGHAAACGLLATALIGPGACAPADEATREPDRVSVMDSAGITIVSNYAPERSDTTAWRVAEEPTWQLGSRDGDAPDVLFRATGAVMLESGAVAVADRGNVEVRVFDPYSGPLRSFGRAGEGPGEFGELSELLALPGDSVLVYDRGLHRIQIFDADGSLVSTIPIRTEEDGVGRGFVGRFPDGSFVTRGTRTLMESDAGDGVFRNPSWVSHVTADGSDQGRLLEFPGTDGFMLRSRGVSTTALAPTGSFPGVTGDMIVLSYGRGYEFGFYSADGAPRRVVRRAHTTVPIPVEVSAEWRTRTESRLERVVRGGISLAGIELPETYPAIGRLEVSRSGDVWIQDHRAQDADGPDRWSVFDRDGRWVSEVVVPRHPMIFEFGDDYLLTLWLDELNVPFVRRYEIIKPAI